MDGQSNARPVIIKRKKVIQGGGHHGGAWKVAYADFVTAMMAFFMLMWLLNATTEKQRKGLADYFSPTIPINRISGGGDGAFSGDSVTSQGQNMESGMGASAAFSPQDSMSEGEDGGAISKADMQAQAEELEKALAARGGESMTMQQSLRHVITRVTDEGLVIEIFDLDDTPLFEGLTAKPMPVTKEIAGVIADVLAITKNKLAVNGYVRAFPIVLIENPAWAISAGRAQAMRELLQEAGSDSGRVQRVSGFADRKAITADPMAIRNNRLEVVLLRRDR
jgi:chemotaxis protein MotB